MFLQSCSKSLSDSEILVFENLKVLESCFHWETFATENVFELVEIECFLETKMGLWKVSVNKSFSFKKLQKIFGMKADLSVQLLELSTGSFEIAEVA